AGFGARRGCARRAGAPPATAAGVPVAGTAARRAQLRFGRLAGDLGAERHVALVDPHLHADAAEGGARLVGAVVDVGPQRVQRLQLGPDPVRLRAAAADHDAGAGGVDVHPDPIAGALDLHPGDAGAVHAAAHHLADGDVFLDVVGVQLVRIPPGLPLGGDAE